jgi:glutathione S-transferase
VKPIFYYMPDTCALGAMAALGYAAIDFDAVLVDLRGPRTELRRVNPAGRVPTLAIGDFVLTENLAIISWAARQAPDAGLLPTEPGAAAQALSIMSWMASRLHIVRIRTHWPVLFSETEAGQQAVQEMGKPLYLAELEQLDRMAAAGMLDAPGLTAYALMFYNWSLLDKVPPQKVASLAAVVRAFAKKPGVAEALQLHKSPIIESTAS